MVCARRDFFIGIVLVFFCCGCAGHRASGQQERSSYLQGYRAGVSANLGAEVESLNGNDFPYLDGTWSAPLIQDVTVPAHIVNGVFYPRHTEPVIIAPGEWKKSAAFPLSAEEPVLETEKKQDMVCDITPMPGAGANRGEVN